MHEQPPVNSQKFWDQLFAKTWEERSGREQTVFFAKVSLDHLPDWLTNEIRSDRYSICDVGCALGDAVHILAKAFPDSKVSGIDFSKEAITKARQFFPQYTFEQMDIMELSRIYDVIFSSNMLEHFRDPFPVFRRLLQNSGKYLILLVPFQDDMGTCEHFFRFDYKHFPNEIDNFRLSFLTEIDCRLMPRSFWNAKQVLAIYKRNKGN